MLEVLAKGKRTRTKRMRPLTRICQLCLKFTHCTVDCWVQEKNKDYPPRNWKDTFAEARNDLATINEAIVKDTLRKTPKGLHLRQGNCQNDYAVEEGQVD